MVTALDRHAQLERELLHERFADFERAVLQDNIVLCDAKSGILLAFSGAMIVFCVDTFVTLQRAHAALPHQLALGLFPLAALAFLVACHFSLTTVAPRLRRAHVKSDHIFWEAPVFRLSEQAYIAEMEKLDVESEWYDKLRHLHMLAGICRTKFGHFRIAVRCGQIGFVTLVLAEFGRVLT